MHFEAPLASKETLEARHIICSSCEYKTSILGLEQCGKCGCVLNVKLRLKNTFCPIGKWKPE